MQYAEDLLETAMECLSLARDNFTRCIPSQEEARSFSGGISLVGVAYPLVHGRDGSREIWIAEAKEGNQISLTNLLVFPVEERASVFSKALITRFKRCSTPDQIGSLFNDWNSFDMDTGGLPGFGLSIQWKMMDGFVSQNVAVGAVTITMPDESTFTAWWDWIGHVIRIETTNKDRSVV